MWLIGKDFYFRLKQLLSGGQHSTNVSTAYSRSFSPEIRYFFLPYTKYASEKLPFSSAKSLADCSPPIYAVLPETKKDPCIQSMSDGHRGLKDDLYDQRNAVIFSENAKKPSLNMQSDWALECDISRWGVRIKKQFQITGWYLFCREGLKKYFDFWISNFLRWKRLIFARKYDKSTDFSVLLFVTSILSCIDGGNGGTRTLDLTDVNRAL